MNEIKIEWNNKQSLLAGDKLMPQMHLRQPRLTCSVLDHLLKPKHKYKDLKKQKIHNIFIKMN